MPHPFFARQHHVSTARVSRAPMSSTTGSTTSHSSQPPARGQQETKLVEACQKAGWPSPVFTVLSDKRGVRTAWSCHIQLGARSYNARFWYDGQVSDRAREDVAEVAMEDLGIIPKVGLSPNQILDQNRRGNRGRL